MIWLFSGAGQQPASHPKIEKRPQRVRTQQMTKHYDMRIVCVKCSARQHKWAATPNRQRFGLRRSTYRARRVLSRVPWSPTKWHTLRRRQHAASTVRMLVKDEQQNNRMKKECFEFLSMCDRFPCQLVHRRFPAEHQSVCIRSRIITTFYSTLYHVFSKGGDNRDGGRAGRYTGGGGG